MGCPICSGSLLSDDFSVIEKQGRRVIIQGVINAIMSPPDEVHHVPPFSDFFTVTIYPPSKGSKVKYLKFRTREELEGWGFIPEKRIRCEGCLHKVDEKELVFDVTKVEFL